MPSVIMLSAECHAATSVETTSYHSIVIKTFWGISQICEVSQSVCHLLKFSCNCRQALALFSVRLEQRCLALTNALAYYTKTLFVVVKTKDEAPVSHQHLRCYTFHAHITSYQTHQLTTQKHKIGLNLHTINVSNKTFRIVISQSIWQYTLTEALTPYTTERSTWLLKITYFSR